MNVDLLNILKQITAKNGDTLLSDHKRVNSFLSDLAQDVPKPQKTALLRCLEHGFAQTLKNAAGAERADIQQRLAQQLHDEEGLDLRLCGETLELLVAVLFSYYLSFNYQETGPYDESVIKGMIANGKITGEYFIRPNNSSEWKPIEELFKFPAPVIVINSAISSGSGSGGYGTQLIEPADSAISSGSGSMGYGVEIIKPASTNPQSQQTTEPTTAETNTEKLTGGQKAIIALVTIGLFGATVLIPILLVDNDASIFITMVFSMGFFLLTILCPFKLVKHFINKNKLANKNP